MMTNYFVEIQLIIDQHLPTYITFWVGKMSFFNQPKAGFGWPLRAFRN